MTDITILIDNTPSENLMLKHEHGLSFAFSLNNRNYLLDTGLSGKAFENATYLGIDIKSEVLGLAKRNIEKEYLEAKSNKDFAKSDELRNVLISKGIM